VTIKEGASPWRWRWRIARRGRRARRITILEVLTAFVLLAVALASILQIFSSGLRDAQLADEYARAVMIAQSRLAAFTASEKMEEGAGAGTDSPFTWSLTALPYDDRQEDAAAARRASTSWPCACCASSRA